MRSMLDGEEMRQEMERLKESDAITEAIREFGKVGIRRVYTCGAMGLPSSASVASFVGPHQGGSCSRPEDSKTESEPSLSRQLFSAAR